MEAALHPHRDELLREASERFLQSVEALAPAVQKRRSWSLWVAAMMPGAAQPAAVVARADDLVRRRRSAGRVRGDLLLPMAALLQRQDVRDAFQQVTASRRHSPSERIAIALALDAGQSWPQSAEGVLAAQRAFWAQTKTALRGLSSSPVPVLLAGAEFALKALLPRAEGYARELLELGAKDPFALGEDCLVLAARDGEGGPLDLRAWVDDLRRLPEVSAAEAAELAAILAGQYDRQSVLDAFASSIAASRRIGLRPSAPFDREILARVLVSALSSRDFGVLSRGVALSRLAASVSQRKERITAVVLATVFVVFYFLFSGR